MALADLIEGSAVKRAYQKALLCLHPDKLQQKGAAPHKLYVAEIIFNTLQVLQITLFAKIELIGLHGKC